MNLHLIQIYNHSPSFLRTVFATFRGVVLHSWRYGHESEELVSQALERDHWTEDQWKKYQEEKLAFILHRAATRVPYYREQWDKRRREGDQASWECLENWPILNKQLLRANPMAFVADDRDIKSFYHERTSGTSGTPLDLWWSKKMVVAWFALLEARVRRWSSVTRHENWAILGGQAVVPPHATKPPFWVWNAAMNQLYLSANHVSKASAPAYMKALREHKITHMIAYSSSVAALSREASRAGCEPAELKLVATNAEPLYPWQRTLIKSMLSSNVRETYGMAEAAAAASECEHGHLHIWPEVGWIESVNDGEDTPAVPGEAGRLIHTGLLNEDMPLVRYAVGDRGSGISKNDCPCSRSLPIMAPIEGRSNDMLVAPDGRHVYWVNPVFYGKPVLEAQIIQETLRQVRVRYIPAPGFTAETEQAIVENLRGRLGSVEVLMESVDSIPREANNKFRAVVCKIKPEEMP